MSVCVSKKGNVYFIYSLLSPKIKAEHADLEISLLAEIFKNVFKKIFFLITFVCIKTLKNWFRLCICFWDLNPPDSKTGNIHCKLRHEKLSHP